MYKAVECMCNCHTRFMTVNVLIDRQWDPISAHASILLEATKLIDRFIAGVGARYLRNISVP